MRLRESEYVEQLVQDSLFVSKCRCSHGTVVCGTGTGTGTVPDATQ